MSHSKSFARRLLKIGGGIFVAFILVLVAVPFFIKVDDYRPQIVSTANQYLNGKLELGKLSLSLWGQVRVNADGFAIFDSKGKKVVSSNSVYFHLPLLSILTGSPEIDFRMQKPELSVVKDKVGKMNVLTLAKTQPTTAAPAPAPAASTGSIPLPAIARRARLSVHVSDASLSYRDEATALISRVNDLNVALTNISTTHPIQIELSANLDTRMGDLIQLKGPAKFSGTIETRVVSESIDGAKLKFNASFAGAKLEGEGNVLHLATTPEMHFKIQSNEIPIAPFAAFVPSLKTFELGGQVQLNAQVDGTAEALQYGAHVSAKQVTAHAPGLKGQPVINATIAVKTDQIESLVLAMSAPGTDMKLNGRLISFSSPKADFQLVAKSVNLDELLDFPKVDPKTKAIAKPAAAPPTPQLDVDALLDPLRKNPMAVKAVATFKVSIAQLISKGIRMEPVDATMSLRNLVATLDSFRVNLWKGSLRANASSDLKPRAPTYRFNMEMSGLDLKEAVTSQFILLQNTLVGILASKAEGSGSSFNTPALLSNLNVKGNMKVEKASFATIDVGQMAMDSINKSVGSIGDRIPSLKGKGVRLDHIESKYESISSDFTISNGLFVAPNFLAKAETGKGLDVKGHTQVGLKDYALGADWEIADTYNLTKIRDISVNQSGVDVPHVFADGNAPIRIPVKLTGTVFAPTPSYGSVAESLAKVALSNIGKAVMRKTAEDQLHKVTNQAAPKVQEALKGLGKSIFGN